MSNQVNFQNQRSIAQTSFFHIQAHQSIRFEIFSYLTPQDLAVCSQVCRLFKDITNMDNFTEEKTLWTRLFKQHFPNAILPKHITKNEFAKLALFEKRLSQGLCTSTSEIINSKSINEPCYANLSSDGKIILAYKSGLIRICDPIENKCIELISENQECPREIVLSASQVLSFSDKKVAVWDIQKRKFVGSFEAKFPIGFGFNLTAITEDQIVLPINEKYGFKVCDLESGDVIFTENQAHQLPMIKILALKNGKIVTLSSDQTLKIWDTQQKKCIQEITSVYIKDKENPILFETKMGQIFFLSFNNLPCLLDPETGKQILFTQNNENTSLEFSESHIIGTYKKNIYYNAFETQNCKLILNCYKILYILDLKTHRIESIKLLQKDEVLKSIRSLPSDKILGIGLSGRLSIIDLQTKKIDSIESPYFTSAIKIAVIKDQKILILKNTKDYNIQLLVNLNFTDSTINILKNLANMFDARKQYNAG